MGDIPHLFIILIGKLITGSTSLQTRTKCGQNQYTVVNSSGVIGCKPCIRCMSGFEAYPACGSDVQAEASLLCRSCKGGHFQSLTGPSPCERCSQCAPHQIYLKKCSASSDAICGSCQEGYFPSDDSIECLPCCKCSGVASEVKHPNCERPKECRPISATGKCRNETPISLLKTTVSVMVQGSGHQMMMGTVKSSTHWSNKMFVLTIALSGLVLLLALTITIHALKKRRQQAYKASFIRAVYSHGSQSSIAPFASTSTYPIDVPSVVTCPIKSCRENFCDELLKDVRVSGWSKYNLTKDEATRLYRSLLNCAPQKKDVNFEDLLFELECYDASFKISTLIYYLQEIERNDILKAIHTSLHQSLETVPLTDNCEVP